MPLNRVVVGKRHAPSRRMSGICPISCLQQHGVKQPDLDNFARHSIDFNPIAQANPVPPHQHKPAKEADNEILQRDSEAGARKAKECTELAWRTKNHQQDQ